MTKVEEIGIESSLLKQIMVGEKTVEARLGKPRFLNIRPGDRLKIREDVWVSGEITASLPSSILLEVQDVLYFESFSEMFKSVDYTLCLPSAKTQEDALAAYQQFYTKKDEEKYGVVALFFAPVKRI